MQANGAVSGRVLPHDLLGDTKLPLISKTDPARRNSKQQALLEAMAGGGDFGADSILPLSGGLVADAEVIPLTPREIAQIAQLIRGNEPDWSNVEPSIFGTPRKGSAPTISWARAVTTAAASPESSRMSLGRAAQRGSRRR
jgi:hypothetical protein